MEFLAREIPRLGKVIADLDNEIEDLLKEAWKALNPKHLWDKIRGKKKERSQAASTRQEYRARQPAATAHRDEAKKILDRKTEEAVVFPSPYVSGEVAGAQELCLGALSQAEIQHHLVGMIGGLPGELKSGRSRKQLFGRIDTAALPLDQRLEAARRASEEQYKTYRNMSGLVKAGGNRASGDLLRTAQKTLIAQAVDATVGAETDRLLAETVGTLPTMAYDRAVYLVLDRPDGPDLCLTASGSSYPPLEACRRGADRLQAWVFSARGQVRLRDPIEFDLGKGGGIPGAKGRGDLDNLRPPKLRLTAVLDTKGTEITFTPVRRGMDGGASGLFFFDRIDGVIRYVAAGVTSPLCLRANGTRAVGGECPGPGERVAGAHWRLGDPDDLGKPVARAAAPVQSGGGQPKALPGLAPRSRTNLAPMQLVPPAR